MAQRVHIGVYRCRLCSDPNRLARGSYELKPPPPSVVLTYGQPLIAFARHLQGWDARLQACCTPNLVHSMENACLWACAPRPCSAPADRRRAHVWQVRQGDSAVAGNSLQQRDAPRQRLDEREQVPRRSGSLPARGVMRTHTSPPFPGTAFDVYPVWQRVQQAWFLTHGDTHELRHILPGRASPDQRSVVSGQWRVISR
jgi:hypothetical protein